MIENYRSNFAMAFCGSASVRSRTFPRCWAAGEHCWASRWPNRFKRADRMPGRWRCAWLSASAICCLCSMMSGGSKTRWPCRSPDRIAPICSQLAFQYADEQAFRVCELSEQDGIHLMSHLAPRATENETERVRALVQAVGALPLALTLIGRHLHLQERMQQPRRLHTTLESLHDAQQRFLLALPQAPLERSPGLPAHMPISLQAAIALSDHFLDDEGRIALRALAAFPSKPDTFSEEAALAVTGLRAAVLDRLSDAGLLENGGPGR